MANLPRPSRRAVIGGLGAVAAGGVASEHLTLDGPEAWTPPAGTWPLARRDTHNSAAAREATVPADPDMDWTASVAGTGNGFYGTTLLADRERVYAGAGGLAAFDRRDGSVVWRDRSVTPALALRDGRLFAGREGAVEARDPATGEHDWRARVEFEHPRRDEPIRGTVNGLTVTTDAVLAGGFGGAVAFGTDTGARRWRETGAGCVGPPTVHRGAMFTGLQGLSRYGPRDLNDPLTRAPPARSWTVDGELYGAPAGARSLAITGIERLDPTGAEGPTLRAADTGTGSVAWSAEPSHEDDIAAVAGPTAVDERRERVYAPVAHKDGSEGYPDEASVAAFRLTDGMLMWRRPLGPGLLGRDSACTDETLVVALSRADQLDGPAGLLLAFDVSDGSPRWRWELYESPGSVALLDGRVLVLTGSGTVMALG